MVATDVLVDSDFHLLADDHEALLMLAAAHRDGGLRLLGLTTVTGNTWAGIAAVHAAEALAAMGLAELAVSAGACQPLLHRQADFAHRSRLYGAAFGGAWGSAGLLAEQPPEKPVAADGGQHGVSFLIDTLRAAERPLTLLAIGPLTNIALALRIAPDIRERIERVVCMGGAFFVHGNVTPSAEFNWWFDPEAAAIVLEEDLDLVVVPLDATDRVVLDYQRYKDWEKRFAANAVFTRFHRPKFEHAFAGNREFRLPAWDAVAAACLLDPGIVRRERELWLTVDCSAGPSYGRVVSFPDAAEFNLEPPARRAARVVLEIDALRFWSLYEDLVFGQAG